MVPLALAKACHHKAKLYAREHDLAKATAALRQVLVLHFPPGAAEGEDIRLDARARLAELLAEQHHFDDALRTLDEGIAERTRDSFFVANLYTVQGEVHEARAADLDAQGRHAAATAERREANASYDRSNAVIQRLPPR